MENQFFEKPILNSPYGYPVLHWELDKTGQPTQKIIDKRRPAEFITVSRPDLWPLPMRRAMSVSMC